MSSTRRFTSIALILLAVVAGGCTTKYEVQSDTSWSGFVEDHSVAGTGCTTYTARSGGAATFTKSTEGGFLRARVVGWGGDDRWVETTAPYGTVVLVTNDARD